jgi:2-polyprenyl-3-methyl-5-hydroxy-6-metoxy-1,4-benzoquinol methylase
LKELSAMARLGLLSEFYVRAKSGARRRMQHVNRAFVAARGLPIPHGFFDEYPQFYYSSNTGNDPNRLNQRYRACIEWNESVIRGKRILDIASHDGRWCLAAMKAGAANVVGIEARERLVDAAAANLRKYGVAESSYRFILGDALDSIDQIEPHSVDTVFCLGFFYHVVNHMLLLSKIARLKPKYLVLDTEISLDPRSIISLRGDDSEIENNAIRARSDAAKLVLVGVPSKSALELMLSNYGWSFAYYDWHRAGIRRWDSVWDYHQGERITMRVNCAP